jgi:hypothetical protein
MPMSRDQVGATGLLAVLVIVGLVACGGNEDDGDGDGDALTRVTCDLRNLEGFAPTCHEHRIPRAAGTSTTVSWTPR